MKKKKRFSENPKKKKGATGGVPPSDFQLDNVLAETCIFDRDPS